MIRLGIRDRNGFTEAEFLDAYNITQYERPSVAADMVIFTVDNEDEGNYRKLAKKKLKILLVKRGVHPYLGQWALPGGFLRPNENLALAAQRELKEETGVDYGYLEQLYTFSNLGRDPRGWVLSCAYMALIDHSMLKLKAGDDADDAKWFEVKYKLISDIKEYTEKGLLHKKQYELSLTYEEVSLNTIIEQTQTISSHTSDAEYRILENNNLAFDHGKIIGCALERLRGKIEYTDIAFSLMPEQFTLTELQNVYEIIMDKELLKAAFRRKIEYLVEKTNDYAEKQGHRPSKLYRRKQDSV